MFGIDKERIHKICSHYFVGSTDNIFNEHKSINEFLGIDFMRLDNELYGRISMKNCNLSVIESKSNGMIEVSGDRVKIKAPNSIGDIKIINIEQLVLALISSLATEINVGDADKVELIKYIDFSESDLSYTINADDVIGPIKDNLVGDFDIILPTGDKSMKPYVVIDILSNSGGIGNPEELLTSIDYSETVLFSLGGILGDGATRELRELDFTGKKFTELTGIGYLFYGCENLERVKFDRGAFPNVTHAHHMFRECPKLKEFNMDAFCNSTLLDSSYMFYGCESLKKLTVNCGWENVFSEEGLSIVATEMFYGCSKLDRKVVENFVQFMANKDGVDINGIATGANIELTGAGFNRLRIPNDTDKLRAILPVTLSEVWDVRGYRAYENGEPCVFDIIGTATMFYYEEDREFQRLVKVIVVDRQTYAKVRRKKIHGRTLVVLRCEHEDVDSIVKKHKMFSGNNTDYNNDILVVVDDTYC